MKVETIFGMGGYMLFVRVNITRAGNILQLESPGNKTLEPDDSAELIQEMASEELINMAAEFPEVFATLNIDDFGEYPGFVGWYKLNHE